MDAAVSAPLRAIVVDEVHAFATDKRGDLLALSLARLHALAPEALLQVYRDLERTEPPPCTLLAIRAHRFELGEAPGERALADLALALAWAMEWARLPEEIPA